MKDLIKTYLDRYLNKLEIGYRLPEGVKLEQFWEELEKVRARNAEQTTLIDQNGKNFWYNIPHVLQKRLHEIDSDGRDTLFSAVKAEIAGEMIKESLIEEALNSSVIEGAFSTLKRAKELAYKRETPKDNSEQMILNNFYAMRFIVENVKRPFSREVILELHKIVTEKTLEEKDFAGKFRDGAVYVVDREGKAIYTPPPADQLVGLVDAMIDWVNRESDEAFIHPVIKASIIHFYFIYLHPFFDGNGRTARALFYFYLLKNRYEFFRYFSISSMIRKNRSAYYQAIKEVEDYNSDLTYFLLFMGDCVVKAIAEIKTKIAGHYQRDYYLNKIKELQIALNPRQESFLKKFLLWSAKEVSVRKYRELFKVVYQTARTDLLALEKAQILIKTRKGKKFVFVLNTDF